LEREERHRLATDGCWGAIYPGWVIANMHIYFERTSLFNTLVMPILLVGGIGLIARAIQPHDTGAKNGA